LLKREVKQTLLPEFLCEEDPERTLAEVDVAERQGEFTRREMIFETFDVAIQAKVFDFAEMFESAFSALEPFAAFHLPYNFHSLLSDFLIHRSSTSDA